MPSGASSTGGKAAGDGWKVDSAATRTCIGRYLPCLLSRCCPPSDAFLSAGAAATFWRLSTIPCFHSVWIFLRWFFMGNADSQCTMCWLLNRMGEWCTKKSFKTIAFYHIEFCIQHRAIFCQKLKILNFLTSQGCLKKKQQKSISKENLSQISSLTIRRKGEGARKSNMIFSAHHQSITQRQRQRQRQSTENTIHVAYFQTAEGARISNMILSAHH